MLTFPSPIIGIVFGISLICFRSVVAVSLEKTIAKFPYYKMGGVNISFKVRPIFIAAFGAIVSLFSMFGLIIMCSGKKENWIPAFAGMTKSKVKFKVIQIVHYNLNI